MSTTESSEQFWETFYSSGRGRWSGKPNPSLVEEVSGLRPGSALDLGCGQGADAIWLALQGWQVTAVDVSAAALEVAARAAEAAGVADAPGTIVWDRRDIADALPAGSFDLVAATFLHSPVEGFPRTRVLREAAATVAPGGTLLIVGHAPSDAHPELEFPSPEETIAELALVPDEWQVRTSVLREQQHAFRDEAPTQRVDSVVRLERAGG
ncbi:class I SAM-dependent methyltransferase [Conexibacter stalactiti]|uniref:Class I SAM-dependent methyltransferase n=1 Tax=Conexibacter stalactiti TaxID=1940611 RepID=A0ABU4HKL1_9ACTN|nr:class I SAM-dependent methyltransferase [Conexibacter stalactiti]MDW5593845.1 class I SAM-dependent methyltransferase [Conexibacter stalactiti]MEC5034487.1 class I SAM-dependent methyltransferase [Conexibacter stalactiti]